MIKQNTALFLIAATVLAVVHFLALEFFLYWRFLWLDLPVHALGGAVVALGYQSVRDFRSRLPERWFALVPTLCFVFFVAILWELFEAAAGLSVGNADLAFDTASDLLLGLLGVLIGYFVASRIQELA